MDKERLYDFIDEEDDMTDQEKREAYSSEVAEAEAEEYWKNGYR